MSKYYVIESMMPKRIVILGGSTVYGQGDSVSGGFVARLRVWHESKNPANQVFNLGVGGDAITEMIQRGPNEAKVRRPDLIIVYPGLNDTRRLNSRDAQPQTTKEGVASGLRDLTQALKAVAPTLLMSAVPPDENRTCPIWGKWFFTRDDARQMALLIKEVAESEGTFYLPVFERWQDRADLSNFLADGLHCNSLGHQLLFEEVRDSLIEIFCESGHITTKGTTTPIC